MGCYKLHNYTTLRIAHTSNTARSREGKSDAGLYKYKFGAKEWQDELSLNLYDFEARNYDPAIVRTLTMDPLAEKFYNASPYSFLNNNPLYFVDPTGMAADGWIKSITDEGTSYTYDANVNTVDEATAAGYENVADVQQGYNISSTNGSYSYNLNQDGTVTNASDGSNIQFHKPIAGESGLVVGGAFQTGGGSKIYTNNLGEGGFSNLPRASGAATALNFASPFFSWGWAAKGISAAWGAAFGTTRAATTTTALAHYYPPNGGAMGGWSQTTLSVGAQIDRYGSSAGSYFSPAGTPLPMRALPPGNTGVLTTYQVIKPFNVQSSSIAPAFNQVGTGIQYHSPFLNAGQLVQSGYLMPIK